LFPKGQKQQKILQMTFNETSEILGFTQDDTPQSVTLSHSEKSLEICKMAAKG
jgi:hypothetical protein